MHRKDYYLNGLLFLIVLLIFYPVCFTEYVYTDEITQLWHYRPGSGFTMFREQGRWVTEFLISRSFAAISTIYEITYIRIATLLVWLICIPVWYTVIKRMAAKQPQYEYLPFFTCLYLVTSLPFAIAVQWASCMELPIANTAGLLSGAILYFKVRGKENWFHIPVPAAIAAAVFGLISLSAYQSGFGCFLIPFLFHYISAYTTNKDKVFIKGLAFYFFMYGFYFVLFRLSLRVNNITNDPRADLHIDVFDKLQFFFSQPLKRAFWFNVIVDDYNKLARAIYKVLFTGWMVLAFVRFGIKNWVSALKYVAAVLIVFIISYLPSLVVKESFSSNRTLLAINMCVLLVCAEMVLFWVQHIQVRQITGIVLAGILIISGWYNFNKQFLQPVHEEYVAVTSFIKSNYNRNIKTVYFIQPAADAFQKKYHIQSSMDEFGVPSTFFSWVPEDITRQIIYEKTRNRQIAEQVVIKNWPDKESFKRSGEAVSPATLVVDAAAIILSIQR